MFKIVSLALASILVSACDTDFSNPVAGKKVDSGSADFTTYVSIGDSLTAGYADGALYLKGQENSYPAILAQQFSKAGGGDFTQPLVSDNLGGLLFGGAENPDFSNRLVMDLSTETPEPIEGTPGTEVIGSGLNGSQFNNVGVPGAKVFHLGVAGYGDPAGLATDPATANPYYVRFASSATATVIGDAAAQQPSFFTLWIGNNDVLSYATSGGVGVDQTGNTDPTSYGSNDITDPAAFAVVYEQLIAALKAANPDVKGVLINIPDVSAIPYFTTVPYNPVPLDQETADTLNAAYAAYNGGLLLAQQAGALSEEEVAKRTITFAAGQNAVVIMDEDLTDITGIDSGLISMRQASAEDLLVLTASSKIGTLADPEDPNSAWGLGVPLEDGDVLIPSELEAIETARLAYNGTIKSMADDDDNLLFMDAAAMMDELSTTGIDYGTGFMKADYASGGAFSLDGVHPTARGYAEIANRIIDTINNGFAASVPGVDPGAYTTIFVK